LLIGTPDILVNNAGIQGPTVPIDRHERSAWDSVIAVNLTSVFAVTKAFVPDMRRRKSGRIINIASVAGLRGLMDGCAYGASKAGVIGLTIGLSKELMADGITVNCVAPALVETDLLLQMSPEFIEKATDRVPMKRLGRPEEVAATRRLGSPAPGMQLSRPAAVFNVAVREG